MNASSYLNLSHHSLFLLQAFGFALARMGLGLEGAAANEDDQLFRRA